MFLDTSGLMVFFDGSEERHAEAKRLFSSAATRVTHNYVLAEFVTLAHARRLNRKAVLTFLSDLVGNPRVETVWVTRERHHAALALLQSQLDKHYSLCDAVSFLLMRERNLTEALTTDHHFDQAGLKRLLP